MNIEQQIVELIKGGGCFVSTKISLYRGRKSLTAEELGIEKLPKKLISLGSMNLIPDEICGEYKIIKQVEKRINALVNLMTFDFEGFGRYLKNSESQRFAEQINGLRTDFDEAVASFVERYDDIVEQSVQYWGNLAHTLNLTPEQLCPAVRDSFPHKYQVRSKFKLVVTYLQIPDPAKEAWSNANAEYAAMSSEFLELTMRQIREEAFNMMNEMANAIANDKWSNKTLNRIPKMLERMQQMQLVEDDELKSRIESFKKEFITMDAQELKKPDNKEALDNLRNGIGKAVSDLKEMAEEELAEKIEKKLSGGGRKLVF